MEQPAPVKARTAVVSSTIVIAIVLLGFFLRSIGVNWDQNQHLHPDERFLTMVMGAMTVPSSFEQYLDPNTSTFNPSNVGHPFFVYGTFPLVFTKLASIALDHDDYWNLTLQGRWFSAFSDTISVLVVILISREFEKRFGLPRNLKYFAGLFYAVAVFPIQQAHFFTVDTFANMFFLLSFLWALKTDKKRFFYSAVLSGGLMGVAVACKINVILGAPIVGWFLVETFSVSWFSRKKWPKALLLTIVSSLLWFLSLLLVLRIAEPYYFSKFSLTDWHINEVFLKNVAQLKLLSDREGYFPPGIQWMSKTMIIFPLVNLAVFGLGLPLFFFTLFGTGKLIAHCLKKWKFRVGLLFLMTWILGFFLYEGVQFVLTMRYFLFIYPFLAIFAGYGVIEIGHRISKKRSFHYAHHERIVLACTIFCLIWPLMFISIYTRDHTRVEASRWLYQVLPDKSVIALEHWDDPIPLEFEGVNPEGKKFVGHQLPVFYQDVESKWVEMEDILYKTDYYILTSNRGWGSIMAAPEKYPKMSRFYQDLFDGKTEFELIKEFTSYPGFEYMGIPITFNDDWAEEAFTVYDHPKVMIFAKKGSAVIPEVK